MATKTAIFQEYKTQYWNGSKQEKQAILTHICFVTQMHRKAAIRKFSTLQLFDPTIQHGRGR